MKRYLWMLAAMLFCISAGAEPNKVKYPGGKCYMYRLYLADKQGTDYSLERPEEFLSPKAVERRRRQQLAVDSTDLPVSQAYVAAVEATGAEVVSRSKWNNTLLVRTHNQKVARSLSALPCVKRAMKVFTSPDSIEPPMRVNYRTEFNSWDTIARGNYGATEEQVRLLGGTRLHRAGYRGRGMTIAVLDGGFMNVDVIPCMQSISIAGVRDFVVPQSKDVFKEMDHGTMVLSTMGVNVPGLYVGTAPEATYWLLRCEDVQTESPAEEDYWAAAAEFADSVGVDVINSSLGFHAFDDKTLNHTYAQLDGHQTLISHTASMIASKGMVLVNSAGNDGMGTWKKINFPADAHDIITVGAISPNRLNAAFSSIGPTADGRVKPDVMALGSPAAVITGRGTIRSDIGTSFSAPQVAGLVACLWQACPQKSAQEIILLVRRSADQYATPDDVLGYGVPDFGRALSEGKSNSQLITRNS